MKPTEPKAKHGGARKGAGRRTELREAGSTAKTERHAVTLDAATVRYLRMIGEGNLSAGIRIAAKMLKG